MSKNDDPRNNVPPDVPNDETLVVLRTPRTPTGDAYALDLLFLEWAWHARFVDAWPGSVRALARTLRGLEGAGLIERRTIRRRGHATHHGFVVTPLGRKALFALAGDWISR